MSLEPFHEVLIAAVERLKKLDEKTRYHIRKITEETEDMERKHKHNLKQLHKLSRVSTARDNLAFVRGLLCSAAVGCGWLSWFVVVRVVFPCFISDDRLQVPAAGPAHLQSVAHRSADRCGLRSASLA